MVYRAGERERFAREQGEIDRLHTTDKALARYAQANALASEAKGLVDELAKAGAELLKLKMSQSKSEKME